MSFAVPIELIHAIKRSDVIPFKCFVVGGLGLCFCLARLVVGWVRGGLGVVWVLLW